MNFSAVILAGGKSSRMGRDKAFLELDGQLLLARQISLVHEIGASEIFISGRSGVDYSAFKCQVLLDEQPGLGPLAGIASALDAANYPLLFVLAVDMINLPANLLREFHAHCKDGIGAVPFHGEVAEPLAAFYPKSAARLARDLLKGANPDCSPGAKHFADLCVQAGQARFIPVSPDHAVSFASWNSPADLSA